MLLMLFNISIGHSEVLFPNSVVSNDIDFITTTDPTIASDLKFSIIAKREMPDKRRDFLFDDNTYVFEARFEDGDELAIWAHSDFSSQFEAEAYARTLLNPLGKLPARMRKGLSRIVLHKGNETAFAEHIGQFFVLYSENIITRLKNHDLEETLFHESVHATLDYTYREDSDWLRAQALDNSFVTKYAKDNPASEDLAETSLFVYTQLKHPGRLPVEVEEWLLNNIPNRTKFIRKIFSE